MSHIIIDKAQADVIRGNHGIYSAVEPVPTPDGKFIVPEACLSDADLAEIKTTLESYVTPTNVQEITDLPEVGEEAIKDKIYKYSEGDIDGYNGLVKCVQTHIRTIYKPIETPALFSFFRENAADLEWMIGEKVEVGWTRTYDGKIYEVIQAHQTQVDWTPDKTPTLWKEIVVVVDIPVWKQPTGAHDAYRLGAKVHFPTINDPVYESLIDYNTYSPTAYPAGWRKL